MSVFTTIFTIGIGATIGASLRYYIGELMFYLFGKDLPYGTLSANIIGSLFAGIMVVVVLEKIAPNESYRLMLLVGVAGSLTTMSALTIDSIAMMASGRYMHAGINIILNIVLSIVAATAGIILTRYLLTS